MVKFPGKKWRYKYLAGINFKKIPENISNNKEIIGFINSWGCGKYEFVNSNNGYKIEKKFKITKLNFRATANHKGEPINKQTKEKQHIRTKDCVQCFKNVYNMGYDDARKEIDYKKLYLETEIQKLKSELNKFESQTNQFIHNTITMPFNRATPPTDLSLEFNEDYSNEINCPDCGIPLVWDFIENHYNCFVCDGIFDRGSRCPKCGTEVELDAKFCHVCGY
jgi:hypothetical protein